MPFLERCIILPIINKIKLLVLLVKSNTFGTIFNIQNMQETKVCLDYSYKCWLDKSFASK